MSTFQQFFVFSLLKQISGQMLEQYPNVKDSTIDLRIPFTVTIVDTCAFVLQNGLSLWNSRLKYSEGM